MTIISHTTADRSNYLCKRYALLASAYFENPESARQATARVPLENLFRVLEMYKNDTFADESRSGVLALESQAPVTLAANGEDDWSGHIKNAVHESLVTTFGSSKPEVEATAELQEALRSLVSSVSFNGSLDSYRTAIAFFQRLGSTL